jgi:hypothetical protein
MEQDVTAGTLGVPTQDASGQTSTASAIDYEALATALEPRLAKLVEKQWQSGKDKRIAGLQGKVDKFEDVLARYAEITGQPLDQKAIRDMKLDQLLAQQTGDQSNAAAVSDTTGTRLSDAPGVDVEVLDAMGLNPSSPEVAELLRKGAPLKEYAALAKKAKVVATPAAVMPSASGGGTTETTDTLTAELNELMKHPAKNLEKIHAVSEKLKALLPR